MECTAPATSGHDRWSGRCREVFYGRFKRWEMADLNELTGHHSDQYWLSGGLRFLDDGAHLRWSSQYAFSIPTQRGGRIRFARDERRTSTVTRSVIPEKADMQVTTAAFCLRPSRLVWLRAPLTLKYWDQLTRKTRLGGDLTFCPRTTFPLVPATVPADCALKSLV
ncbi:hypothetical protein K402DRAFT_65804 [Aulographum hederae CBS 113979]|uniref:Uncharacterized protein n=1 Tax=Aulographum hederae CBS 113979 TaxID=1176131 RepID=A0A6G1H125_9PEZI|nr:hypothetical protein K402DRAFT_65804 [Aulographum hederae CBS 113979]